MKYKYIASHPINFQGKTLKSGDTIDHDGKLPRTQFQELEKQVETPKKSKKVEKPNK